MAPVLDVRRLVTEIQLPVGRFAAVNDVSFQVDRGEVVGLVGESGSGKSMTGLSILGLTPKQARVTKGEVMFDRVNLVGAGTSLLRKIRGNRIAMIFQDPMTTLHPLLTIGAQMVEAVLAHDRVSKKVARERSVEWLRQVGIPDPEERLRSYPHELSGGMRQRVVIAIALLHQPDLIIADEPTTALDVTIQGQILAVAQRLSAEFGTSMLWITHDMSVVANFADRVAVMYAGKIVEMGETSSVIDAPVHPYTRGLLGSIPSRTPKGVKLPQMKGSAIAPFEVQGGCPFRSRCGYADARCSDIPPVFEVNGTHSAHCFNPVFEEQLA